MNECKPLEPGTAGGLCRVSAGSGRGEAAPRRRQEQVVDRHHRSRRVAVAARAGVLFPFSFGADPASQQPAPSRDLHSSTFRLNLSALYGIGGARRDCVARGKGVLGGVQGVLLCQTRLKLS